MNSVPTNSSILDTTLVNHLGSDDLFVDQIGKTVARSLDRELSHLSPKVLQRLENARELALLHQKTGFSVSGTQKSLKQKTQFFPRLGPIGPILLVLMLVFVIAQWQQNARIKDIVDVDTAILTDSVPPDAYADDGFRLFMKKMIAQAKEEEKEIESRLETTNTNRIDQESSNPKISGSPATDPSNNQ
ncbi:MAG: DUF3619 family protein [Myxococcaceae bacterium]|jgi:hypothetical protein